MTDACSSCINFRQGFRDQDIAPWTHSIKTRDGRPNPWGDCRLDPAYVRRHQDDWCAKFTGKDKP